MHRAPDLTCAKDGLHISQEHRQEWELVTWGRTFCFVLSRLRGGLILPGTYEHEDDPWTHRYRLAGFVTAGTHASPTGTAAAGFWREDTSQRAPGHLRSGRGALFGSPSGPFLGEGGGRAAATLAARGGTTLGHGREGGGREAGAGVQPVYIRPPCFSYFCSSWHDPGTGGGVHVT